MNNKYKSTNIRPERLAGMRQSKGLTVEELATEMNKGGSSVTASTIYKWEQGDKRVSEELLPDLLSVLGCDEKYLLKRVKQDLVNYDLPLGENIRFKDSCRRQVISVYCAQSDTVHPKVLELATTAGYITEARYEALINPEQGLRAELNPDELEKVLENFFGFDKGFCEIHECHGIQTTRFGDKRAGELRYCGEERTDKEWLESGMASQEVKEFSKYGGEVNMEENKGYGEMVINDFLG